MHFGRKSEKIDRKIEQLETRLEDLMAEEGEADQAPPAADVVIPRKKPEREPLPAHLPREENVLEPEEQACPECGGKLKLLGEDISEQMDLINSAFKVIRHVRRKRACACCDRIVQGPAPKRVIERGIAGPALLAHIAVAKFADHQPLYHQSVIFERQGVELDRSVMARWMGACGVLVRPLVVALHRYVLAGHKLHVDDTPMPVLAPGNGQTTTGRLWVYVRDDRRSASLDAPAVWFGYSSNRQGLHPQAHLEGFQGILQADAFAGFNKIYREREVREIACMAHARRKIHDLHVNKATPTTTEALRRIGELYVKEERIRGMSSGERQRIRQQEARPLLDNLKQWLRQRLLKLSTPGDVLIVTKLDRLGRNAMDVRATVEQLAADAIRVHCLALGGVDLTSAAGRMTMSVLNAVAEFERDLLIERTQAGIARARAEGKTLGRPPALTKVQQAEAMQRLAKGESVAKVARDYATTRQSIMRVRERLSQSSAADS